MENGKIFEAILSLIPFWSNGLVSYFGLGSEYVMIVNIVLVQFTKHLEKNDNFLIILVVVVAIYISSKFIKLNTNFLKFFSNGYRTLTIIDSGENDKNSTIIQALNEIVISKINHRKTILIERGNYLSEEVKNVEIERTIYLTIEKSLHGHKYVLKSSYADLHFYINDLLKLYTRKNYVYNFSLHGTETETTFEYPTLMIQLTFTLYHKYNICKTICKKNLCVQKPKIQEEKETSNKKKDKSIEEDDFNKNFENILLIDNCTDYLLEKEIYLTVRRSKGITTYILHSSKTELKEFVQSCIEYFKNNINIYKKFKYSVILSGFEASYRYNVYYNFSQTMTALNYHVITEHKLGRFKHITNKNTNSYILCGTGEIFFDDIRMTIKQNVESSESFTSTEYIYELRSNTVDIDKYLKDCVQKYRKYLDTNTSNNIYHFKLVGIVKINEKETILWNTDILHSDEKPLYQTFDVIYNEHTEFLRLDLKKLKDVEYYKKTGLKQKKSYLFYGEPGCGKTQSVVAMAIEDMRHIIEIPLNIISSNKIFEEIMNLTEINGVLFSKNRVIYLFDEIDNPCLNKESVDSSSGNVNNISINLSSDETCSKSDKHANSLTIGNVLSKFDGVGNYNGLVIVATTNHIDKLQDSLKRELRLTPVYFTFLRKIDAVKMIELYFNKTLTHEQIDLIPDRLITPAKLTYLCDKHNNMELGKFLTLIY